MEFSYRALAKSVSCFSLVQFAPALQLLVKDEGIKNGYERGDDDCGHRQPERCPQNHGEKTQQASGKERLGGHAVGGIPHAFVGDGPGSANAHKEIPPHLAHDVAHQSNQEADSALHGASDIEYET